MNSLLVMNQIEDLFSKFGYPMIFLSSLIEITPFGWTIPGGLILAVGGFFAYGKTIVLMKTIISGWFGAWSSLLAAYIMGKHTGLWLVKKLKQEKNAQRAKSLLNKSGAIILTSSMLANLTRFWSAYIAGVEKFPFLRFLFYSAAASFTWVSLMVFVGFIAGSERGNLESMVTKTGIASWFFVILTIIIIVVSIKSQHSEFKNENNHSQ